MGFLYIFFLFLFFSFFLFFFFLFFFFESYDYCLLYKILHAARAMSYKNLQYPWEKSNHPRLSGVEQTAHLAPNKKPLTS